MKSYCSFLMEGIIICTFLYTILYFRTPMMDLLIQVTTANKINPGGHVIQVLNDRSDDFLYYKPSTPIGKKPLNVWSFIKNTKNFDIFAKLKCITYDLVCINKTHKFRIIQRIKMTKPFHYICNSKRHSWIFYCFWITME